VLSCGTGHDGCRKAALTLIANRRMRRVGQSVGKIARVAVQVDRELIGFALSVSPRV
jgi:hypothetical protein